MFLSVLTLGEIRKGVMLLPRSVRRTALEAWLRSDLPLRVFRPDIEHRSRSRRSVGTTFALTSARGANVAVIDGLLAATGTVNDLTLVTRNTRDVAATGVSLLNPWTG